MRTKKELKAYRIFRKELLKEGFLMMQESVYIKLLQYESSGKYVLDRVRKHLPDGGIVQALTVTERQFAKMEFLSGEDIAPEQDSSSRLIIL